MKLRDFRIEDPDVLQFARVIRQHFINNMADFTLLDSVFNAGYSTSFLNAITSAEGQATDETTLDGQQVLTAYVDVATANCLKATGDLRYYAEKAFGGKSALYKSFSLNRAWKVSQTTGNFIVYMKVNHKLATVAANQAALIAQGMTLAKITNIKTTADALDLAEQNHELGKRQRLSTTATRVDAFNAMWVFISQLNAAARVIYREVPEKLGLFRIPYKKRKKKEI